MAKYICQCGCETVIEIKEGEKVPICCGKLMKKAGGAKTSKRSSCCR